MVYARRNPRLKARGGTRASFLQRLTDSAIYVNIWSVVTRTIKVKLNCSDEQRVSLRRTTELFTASFNRVCEIGWLQNRINGVELHHLTYYREKATSGLQADLVCAARVKATEALKSARALQKKGTDVSCPSSSLCPIRYNAKSATISLGGGKASLASIDGRQHVTFKVAPYYEQYIDWKVRSSDLCIDRRGRVFLHVIVEAPEPLFVPSGKVLGADLGIKRPAVTSNNKFFGERRWREIEDRYFRLVRKLQAKGTKSAKRHLKKLARRINRFRADCDHVLSRRIVDSVSPGATIVLEDLTDIRARVKARKKQRRRLHGWSFARLKSFLIYKSLVVGVRVEFVDPRYTSQKCSNCGYISRSNRKKQSEFRCKSCGFELNADLNAARNIRNNYLASAGISDAGGPSVNRPIVGNDHDRSPASPRLKAGGS
jgi:IS605 OrfB family transposase